MTIRTLLFALAAGFLLAAPLRAQTTDALDYVDHINVDFAHNTILNTNVALYYRDYTGDLQAPPAYADYGDGNGNTAFVNLFSTKGTNTFSYGPDGAIGWLHATIPFDADISLTNRTQVSYTPIVTYNGPDADYLYTQSAAMTGSRSSLYAYDLASRRRLSTGIPTEPFTPGGALLATGDYTSLITTNGGIYTTDRSNNGPNDLEIPATPLVTTSGTGVGALSNPTAMNVGPDGLLYVLDYGLDEAGVSNGVNRIEKFDLATGEYRGQFFLPDGVTVFSTSLAISLNGHIYLGDGLGGGSVLDLDGNLLGTFHPPAADPSWVDGGLIAGSTAGPSFLQYDGLGNIFTYVEGQGYFMYHDLTFVAVPEPSTCALLGLAMGALFLPFHRRRLRSS